MATRKQKHAEALARREAFLAREKEIGRKSLEKARAERRRKEREAWSDQHNKKHSWKKRLKECPLCQDILNSPIKELQNADEA